MEQLQIMLPLEKALNLFRSFGFEISIEAMPESLWRVHIYANLHLFKDKTFDDIEDARLWLNNLLMEILCKGVKLYIEHGNKIEWEDQASW